MSYPRDAAYRDGVLMAMSAHAAGDDFQCWYWLFLIAPVRPEWLQYARMCFYIFGEGHAKSWQMWECLFYAAANGEFGPVPALFADDNSIRVAMKAQP